MSGSAIGGAIEARLNAAGLQADADLLDRLERYVALLSLWNRRINLTSLPLDNPLSAHTVDRLIVEPLLAASWVRPGDRWADFGSGGGSPSIPMKLSVPAAQLTMIESRERKCAFLREAVRVLQLSGCHVLQSRFEELPTAAGPFDVVTVRAVRLDDSFIDLLLGKLKAKGRLITFGAAVERQELHRISQVNGIQVYERLP